MQRSWDLDIFVLRKNLVCIYLFCLDGLRLSPGTCTEGLGTLEGVLAFTALKTTHFQTLLNLQCYEPGFSFLSGVMENKPALWIISSRSHTPALENSSDLFDLVIYVSLCLALCFHMVRLLHWWIPLLTS